MEVVVTLSPQSWPTAKTVLPHWARQNTRHTPAPAWTVQTWRWACPFQSIWHTANAHSADWKHRHHSSIVKVKHTTSSNKNKENFTHTHTHSHAYTPMHTHTETPRVCMRAPACVPYINARTCMWRGVRVCFCSYVSVGEYCRCILGECVLVCVCVCAR